MFENQFLSYKLVGKNPVRCSIDEIDESVDRKLLLDKVGEVCISTVFLSFDHSFEKSSDPVLFETMIFGGEYDGYQIRYTSYDDAIEGHKQTYYMVNKTAIDRDNKLDNLGI